MLSLKCLLRALLFIPIISGSGIAQRVPTNATAAVDSAIFETVILDLLSLYSHSEMHVLIAEQGVDATVAAKRRSVLKSRRTLEGRVSDLDCPRVSQLFPASVAERVSCPASGSYQSVSLSVAVESQPKMSISGVPEKFGTVYTVHASIRTLTPLGADVGLMEYVVRCVNGRWTVVQRFTRTIE